MAVTQLSQQNIEDTINNNEIVVIDFWAPWCGPCRLIAPVLEELAAENGDNVKITKVNVDDSPRTAQRFDAMSIPTLLMVRDGRVVDRQVGAVPEPFAVRPGTLVFGEKSISGSALGTPKILGDMLAFAARHKVEAMVEQFRAEMESVEEEAAEVAATRPAPARPPATPAPSPASTSPSPPSSSSAGCCAPTRSRSSSTSPGRRMWTGRVGS